MTLCGREFPAPAMRTPWGARAPLHIPGSSKGAVSTSAAAAASAATATATPPTCSASGRSNLHRVSIHGLATTVRNHIPSLEAPLRRALGEFEVGAFPPGFSATEGSLRHYDKQEVLKHLSSTAVRITAPGDGLELYQEGERFWLIDDRWGLMEMNLLKSQWKSWILPEPALAVDQVIELAVTWPLAQLLRAKGLYLLPAATVARASWGMMLVCPFSLEPELTTLLRCGIRLLGQRWSALRDEEGRVGMLHVPGHVERMPAPRLRGAAKNPATGTTNNVPISAPLGAATATVDLESEFPGAAIGHAFCDTVVLVEPGRR